MNSWGQQPCINGLVEHPSHKPCFFEFPADSSLNQFQEVRKMCQEARLNWQKMGYTQKNIFSLAI